MITLGADGRRGLTVGLAVVLLVGFLGVALGLQGWKARIPDLDTIPDIVSAIALVEHGRLPDRGVLTSLLSYAPPGRALMVVPGTLLFGDPRLVERPGAALLFAGSLLGVYLLARTFFGRRCAFLAVPLYGLSESGLYFAGTIGPRGHPFFYVWMVYLTCRWVATRDPRLLGGAVLTWAAGMYVFVELAPAVFILPIIWYVFRPPVRARWLALAAAAALLLWYPYLRLETTRAFADMASQFLVRPLPLENPTALWCDPTIRPQVLVAALAPNQPRGVAVDTDEGAMTGLAIAAGRRALQIGRGLLSNFYSRLPGVDFTLLALTLSALVYLGVPRGRVDAVGRMVRRWRWSLGLGLLVTAGLANEAIVRLLFRPTGTFSAYTVWSIRIDQIMMAAAGAAMLGERSVGHRLARLAVVMRPVLRDATPLVLCLVVPWAVLLIFAEHGRAERYLFLWPVQVVVLSAVLANATCRMGTTQTVWTLGRWALACGLIAAPFASVVYAWRQDGWAGRDAGGVRLVDQVAEQVRASGRQRAAIGYQIFVTPTWGSRFAAADTRYKIGAELDLLLRFRHGVFNTNVCAEGLSPSDEYRVVEARPDSHEKLEFFSPPLSDRFRLVTTSGPFGLYKKEL